MTTEVRIKSTIEIAKVKIIVPVKYDEEDIPNDFPLRDEDQWSAVVDIDTGKIEGWPEGRVESMHMKVTDGGCYSLIAPDGSEVAALNHEYVPHGVVPGEYGDYIELDINESGIITNWPKRPDVSRFFSEEG